MSTMNRLVAGIIFAILIASSILTLQTNATSITVIVPDDYSTIQAAIDYAPEGGTVIIKSGTYDETTLLINKPLLIKSEDHGSVKIRLHPPLIEQPILGGVIMVHDHPIKIDADNVTLLGLDIISDGGSISLNGNQIFIINNTIKARTNTGSLSATGNGTQILNSTHSGLNLHGFNQTIAGNNGGVITVTGSYNLVTENNCWGLTIVGSKNIATSNNIISDGGVGIYLINADSNIICNNTEKGANVGVAFGYANPVGGSFNILAGNIIEGASLWGILLGQGSYNVFYGNLIANNIGDGLALGGTYITAPDNLFFCNIFMNNNNNFGIKWEPTGQNYFDNEIKGNYWDDYLLKYPNTTELNNSGIGVIPFLVYTNGTDNYPLLRKPDVSGIVPTLPEPWASKLPIALLDNPKITYTYSPSITSTPTTPPTPPNSPTISSTVNPTSTALSSTSTNTSNFSTQQPTRSPGPSTSIDVTINNNQLSYIVAISLIAIGTIGLLVYLKKRKKR
jgi:parallel beta-helix repeat protein